MPPPYLTSTTSASVTTLLSAARALNVLPFPATDLHHWCHEEDPTPAILDTPIPGAQMYPLCPPYMDYGATWMQKRTVVK
jgi:hypothetical protein